MSKTTLENAAAILGKAGGEAGTGEAKRRSRAHYQKAGKASAEARAKRALVPDTIAPNDSSSGQSQN